MSLAFAATHNTTILFVVALIVIYLLSLAMAFTKKRRKGEATVIGRTGKRRRIMMQHVKAQY